MRTKSVNSVDKHVGSRVRLRRAELGLSQTDLGDAVGVTFQQIQKYENGTNRIGASRLHRVAEALQVGPAFFFDGLDAAAQAPADHDTLTELIATPDGLALVRAFQRLPKSKLRRSIVALVKALADRQDEVDSPDARADIVLST